MATAFYFFARKNGLPAPGLSPVLTSLRDRAGNEYDLLELPPVFEVVSGNDGASGAGWYHFSVNFPLNASDMYGVVDLGETVTDPRERFLPVTATAAEKPERDAGLMQYVFVNAAAARLRATIAAAYCLSFTVTLTENGGQRGFASWDGTEIQTLFSDLTSENYLAGTYKAIVLTGALAGSVFTVAVFDGSASPPYISYAEGEAATAGLVTGDTLLFCPASASAQLERTLPKLVSDRMERTSGRLGFVAGVAAKLCVMITGPRRLSAFTARALHNAPVAAAASNGFRGPLKTVRRISAYPGESCSVGDRFSMVFELLDGNGKPCPLTEQTPVSVTVSRRINERSGETELITAAAPALVEYAPLGLVRYKLQAVDTAKAGPHTISITIGGDDDRTTWGSYGLQVNAK